MSRSTKFSRDPSIYIQTNIDVNRGVYIIYLTQALNSGFLDTPTHRSVRPDSNANTIPTKQSGPSHYRSMDIFRKMLERLEIREKLNAPAELNNRQSRPII